MRWWLLLFLAAVVASDDSTFLGAMKSILFGAEQNNNSAQHSSNPSYSTFHQYQTVGRSAPPSGQSCTLPRQIGTGPYRIPRWYYNPVRGRCELFYWSGCCGNGNNFQTFQSCQSVCEVDPCSQEREPGVGAVQLQRYFFNKETRICEQFIYFGSAGNRNNFVTLEECQVQCPESPNPCAVSVSAPLSQCSSGSSCGTGSYCHVGAQTQTTVCCPKPAPLDRCQQPLNVGIGSANLQRWYFNPLTLQCQQCVYKGLQGNENNFQSQQECENSCLVNPCKIGTPFRSQGVTVQCSASNPTICPAGHYCHLGADASTSVCCQALGNTPCEEEMTKGEGSAALTRFYYDVAQRKCLTFNYLGSKGNRNNFQSKDQCEESCPVWLNPCSVGQPIMTINQKPFQCHQGAPCTTGYFCHLGFDDATTVCCRSDGDACSSTVKEGNGNHAMARWFYNQKTRQCQPFTYTGMGGNENNFLLREHCEASCPVWVNACPLGDPYLLPNGKPQPCDVSNPSSCPLTHWCHPGPDAATTMCCPGRTDPCIHAVVEGEGPLVLNRYYFDASTRQCADFIFKGLKGNANNFLNLEDCERVCPVQVNPCPVTMSSLKNTVKLTSCSPTKSCPERQWCHFGETQETTVCCPNANPDPCTSPPRNPGTGEFRATRWAFDGSTRKCVPFEYRGLKGNANNFLSRETCEAKCPVFENPCKVGEPYSTNNQYTQCSPQQFCPAGYYCHIGSEANYCCKALGGDPCGQPLDRGIGGAQLQRWYWNQQQQCCLPFSYCGQKGTQNNFLTRQDCDRTCFELDNPCALGEPQMNAQSRPLQCSANANVCGGSFWCHYGASVDTTVCCPGRVEPPATCQQPLVVGTGGASLPRWYYNAANMRCVQFDYQGRMGNQNNFLTQEACAQTCPVFVNPCNQPIPLPPTQCSINANVCGPAAWCHIGATQDTTLCCPSEGDPCLLPLSRGIGNQFMDRFAYNQQTGTCQPFTYSGLQGNQNNFLTLQACEDQCGPNPCFEGRPFVGVDGRPQSCSASANFNTCPANHWCHIGADLSTTVCCPGASMNICNLPMSTGEGNARLERFYFDQQTKTCRPFTYSGLKGNQNNFISLRACQLSCQPLDNPCIGQPATTAAGQVLFCSITNKDSCPVNFWCHIGATPETTVCCPGATNPCSVPLAPGTGNAGLARFYYNPDDRQCLPFQYNGKRGNQNNFESQPECERTCPEQLCLLSIDRGACGGRQTRYAYNRQANQCVPFEYTGCGGNLNNFVSMADCMATCGNVGFRR